MNRKQITEEIANIIQNFRKDELPIQLDSRHVEKWVSQFSQETQDVILFETLHVLNEWYFSDSKIDDILDSILSYITRKYEFSSDFEMLKSVSFIQVQEMGLSQRKMLERLINMVNDRYDYPLKTSVDEETKHYVYIDDGLYTGRRARTDIEECLWLLPRESTLDVFYIVGATQGVEYVKNKLTSIINEQNIQFKIHTYKKLCNNKKVSKTYEYNGECVETYEKYKKCLWPTSKASGIQEIADYYSSLMQLGDNYEKIPYRAYPWENDNGIFSSAQNREVVEIEFLVKGIEIIRSLSKESKMYPLGYNLWPSFGFGSFCAFDMNISNACPLVLWWGNLSKEGNPLDNWYPLLPRRSNAESDEADALDWNSDDFEMEKDQYNMCPDCFCYFGHDQDGGNGFCLDCAWKH